MKTKILCVLLTLACVTSFVVHAQTFDQSMAAYSKGAARVKVVVVSFMQPTAE
jgi:hypothetical protein